MQRRFRRLVAFTWKGKVEEKLTDGAKKLWQADRDLAALEGAMIRAKADLPRCVLVTVNGFEYPYAISIRWLRAL